jgi:FdhE protein
MHQDTTSKILQRLKKQEKEEGNLPLLLEFYRGLLQIQSRAGKSFGTPEVEIDTSEMERRLDSGVPILRFEDIVIDWTLAPKVFSEVLALLAAYPKLFSELPEKYRETTGHLLTEEAAEAWFTGQSLPPALLDGAGDGLMHTAIQATLYPFMAAYALALSGSLKPDFWREGYCPVCGGSPDLAYLENEVGQRWLLCSRCDTAWRFPRLDCPFCRTKEQNYLRFFTDEKGLYRLHVCDNCKSYLKTLDLRKAKGRVLLPLERLYTLDMDTQAIELGYHP